MIRHAFNLGLVLSGFALSASSASAGEVSVTANKDGSYVISGTVEGDISIAGQEVRLASDLESAIDSALGADTGVDYQDGTLVTGPVVVSIGRDDGTAGYYTVEGDVYAFAGQNTLRDSGSVTTLNGVVLFEAEMDGTTRMVADGGAITLVN